MLLETKSSIHRLEIMYKYSFFNNFVVPEAHDFSCDIWLLWNDTSLQIEPLVVSEQIVTVLVKQNQKFF